MLVVFLFAPCACVVEASRPHVRGRGPWRRSTCTAMAGSSLPREACDGLGQSLSALQPRTLGQRWWLAPRLHLWEARAGHGGGLAGPLAQCARLSWLRGVFVRLFFETTLLLRPLRGVIVLVAHCPVAPRLPAVMPLFKFLVAVGKLDKTRPTCGVDVCSCGRVSSCGTALFSHCLTAFQQPAKKGGSGTKKAPAAAPKMP